MKRAVSSDMFRATRSANALVLQNVCGAFHLLENVCREVPTTCNNTWEIMDGTLDVILQVASEFVVAPSQDPHDEAQDLVLIAHMLAYYIAPRAEAAADMLCGAKAASLGAIWTRALCTAVLIFNVVVDKFRFAVVEAAEMSSVVRAVRATTMVMIAILPCVAETTSFTVLEQFQLQDSCRRGWPAAFLSQQLLGLFVDKYYEAGSREDQAEILSIDNMMARYIVLYPALGQAICALPATYETLAEALAQVLHDSADSGIESMVAAMSVAVC